MAVILNVPSDRYCMQCVLDVASCEMVTCKNSSYRSAAAHLCNLPITVCIGQAAAYLKTCEANGAAPSNAAVA